MSHTIKFYHYGKRRTNTFLTYKHHSRGLIIIENREKVKALYKSLKSNGTVNPTTSTTNLSGTNHGTMVPYVPQRQYSQFNQVVPYNGHMQQFPRTIHQTNLPPYPHHPPIPPPPPPQSSTDATAASSDVSAITAPPHHVGQYFGGMNGQF